MYSCGGRPKTSQSSHGFKNLIGLAILGVVCVLIILKIISSSNKVQIADFARNQEIGKLLIGLMLLHNVKSLSNSFVNNLVLPLVQPVLPFLQYELKLSILGSTMELGDFITDLLVFTLNLLFVYLIYITIN